MKGLAMPDIKIHFKELYDLNVVFLNWKERKNLMEQNQSSEVDHGTEILVYAKDDALKKIIKEVYYLIYSCRVTFIKNNTLVLLFYHMSKDIIYR